MVASLNEILSPQVVMGVVYRIRERQGSLSRWMGFAPNRYDPETVSITGPNTKQGDVRNTVFRIFDYTRVVSKGRAPGTGPATVARNPIGEVQVSCARYHEKIPLDYEQLGNLSPLIGPNSQIDPGGQDYIQRQIRFLATQFNQGVELMTTGMIQDNLYWVFAGDDLMPQLGAPVAPNLGFQVPFQVPAGNKNQLNMLGTGNIIGVSWDNVAAPIFKDISNIKVAFAQLTGYAMTDVWVNSTTWYSIISNTEIRNLAGSSNTGYAEYDNEQERGMDGEPTGNYYAILRADPTIKWHICNEVVVTNSDIDPSYSTAPSTAVVQKVVPDKMAFFMTAPSMTWTWMYHGGEYVVENPGMPGALRRGYYFWKEYVTQPSAVDLIGLLNCVPVLAIPKIVAPGTVIF